MRKRFIVPLTLLFVLIMAIPAWAVNLNVNGMSYVPIIQPQVEQGVTVVSLDLIERVLGANTAVAGQTITIKKGANTLIMTLGSTTATLNGTAVVLPGKPAVINDIIMVPMRYVFEKFGASVTWQAENQTIAINYSEKRQDMTAAEMLTKSNEIMQTLNTYKVKADVAVQSKSVISNEPGQVNINMKSQMLMAIQVKPMVIYMKMTSKLDDPVVEGLENKTIETEMLMNENGMFMKMPETGWLKYNMPGMDMEKIMEQSGSQDPLSSLQQMRDMGVIFTFADNQQKNGKNYWVVKITMSPDSISKLLTESMKQINQQGSQDALQMDGINIMNELIKTLKADITYDVWIDQSNYQTAYMELDAMFKYTMNIPADSTTDSVSFTTNMLENVNYEIYDPGVAISVPDVSKAPDFEQYMENQMKADAI